jgi:plasmid segregation protein ParM
LIFFLVVLLAACRLGLPLKVEECVEILGIDIGFGFTKATDGKQNLVFKSVLGEATEIQFRDEMIAPTVADGNHLQVEVDGKSYFVGELAERQSNVRYFTLDQAQFIGKFAKVFALASAAQMVKGFVPVNLVTGLPIGYYQQYKDELAKLLLGEHQVSLVDANGKKTEKSISINKVRVIPQPFGSLFNLMLNDLGEMGDKRLVKDKIGIIDVGFRTSDYTISDKMRYSERGSRTTDSGIARAFNVIASKLRENSGVNIELYRLYEAIDNGSIKIRGKVYDLKTLTDQVFSQLATSIANEVDRLWVDDWDIDAMVITGGGGAVLAKYLKPLLNGEIMAIDPEQDMRLYNVHGYRKFGQHLWARGNTPSQAPAAPKG